MPLTNKFLRYSPEITLEIFTLIWNKLVSLKIPGRIYNHYPENNLETFKKGKFIWIGPYEIYSFGIDNNGGKSTFTEITVQEILGYNPFVKEFILPEKWAIKHSKEVGMWFDKLYYPEEDNVYESTEYKYLHYPKDVSAIFNSIQKGYTEITFEQFQKYVLKTTEQPKVMEKDWSEATEEELLAEAKRRYPIGCTIKSAYDTPFNKTIDSDVFMIGFNDDVCCGSSSGVSIYNKEYNRWAEIISLPETKVESKEVIPEYVECIKTYTSGFPEIHRIFPVKNGIIVGICGYNSAFSKEYFKPSTKAAFAAQNKPKSIEKWSAGSYVVFLNNNIQGNGFNKGNIQQISEHNPLSITYYSGARNTVGDEGISKQIKWFATLHEAEEFAKTLVEPVNYDKGIFDAADVKQPLQQAVHCKTQEEWDFVLSKFNPRNLLNKTFKEYDSKSIIIITGEESGMYGEFDYEKYNYQLLSFQEWCDLNGYKMGKEVKFEIGEWYKYEKWYIKYLKHDDGIWTASEYINDKKSYRNLRTSFGRSDSDSKKVLASIEEIQQYLPDGHPDKIKVDREFKVGDWVYHRDSKVFQIAHIKKDFDQVQATNLKIFGINTIRHATPEEINQHLISIGQIPAGEPLNIGIEPNKDGMFKYTTYAGTTYVGKISTISGPLKMTLSIDDEELPMVSIIKTNSIKQLLNLE